MVELHAVKRGYVQITLRLKKDTSQILFEFDVWVHSWNWKFIQSWYKKIHNFGLTNEYKFKTDFGKLP